jgi:hypothetical protein
MAVFLLELAGDDKDKKQEAAALMEKVPTPLNLCDSNILVKINFASMEFDAKYGQMELGCLRWIGPLRVRSPLSIAAASNCANSRTWVVKFPAMALTESLERKEEYVVNLRSEMVGEEGTYVITCQIP